jgi:hypothetical protein
MMERSFLSTSPCRRGGPYVFERLERIGILGVMSGTGGELPEAHGPQFPAEGLLADRNAELLEHPLRQINQPPADHAMSRRYRPRFDDPHQSPPLLVAQERRVARRLAV